MEYYVQVIRNDLGPQGSLRFIENKIAAYEQLLAGTYPGHQLPEWGRKRIAYELPFYRTELARRQALPVRRATDLASH